MDTDSLTTAKYDGSITWTSGSTTGYTPFTWVTNSSTVSSGGTGNYGAIYPAPVDEEEIEKRAEEKAKVMLSEQLKQQYRVKERGWGNIEGYEFFRNTLVECNGKKAVVISTGYTGVTITTNSYMAKYEKPLWVADAKNEIKEKITSTTLTDGDTNHDRRVSEIVEYLRKEEAEEDGEI